MKSYLVKVTAPVPYPVDREIRVKASSQATAASRAIKEFRKEFRGKKIDEIGCKVTTLGPISPQYISKKHSDEKNLGTTIRG